MQKKVELYRIARLRVAARRQRAIMEAEANHRQALAAIPELAQTEAQISLGGINAVMASVRGLNDRRKAESLAESEAARKKRDDLLRAAGYAPAQLEPRYTCDKCKDTGVYNSHVCPCVHQLARTLRREEINAASPLALCGFDTFLTTAYPDSVDPELGGSVRTYMTKVLNYCKKYADTFSHASPSLLFTGSAGLGKTHLALAIADTVLSGGFDAIYASCDNLIRQLEQTRFSDDENVILTAAKEADLLILDDLGTEYISPYAISVLYDLVNTRMLRGLPTIYTTNIVAKDAFEARYTEKVASRIMGGSRVFRFFGTDLRLQKKK